MCVCVCLKGVAQDYRDGKSRVGVYTSTGPVS